MNNDPWDWDVPKIGYKRNHKADIEVKRWSNWKGIGMTLLIWFLWGALAGLVWTFVR